MAGVMESLTKRRLDCVQLEAAVARALGGDVRVSAVDELPEGMFNAVYRVCLQPGDRSVVVKSSPPAQVPLLTYERDILRTEAAFYQRASEVLGLPVPEVLACDFTRKHFDGDLLFLSFLEGQGWHQLHEQLDAGDERRLRRDLGGILRGLHTVRGKSFGYFQPGAARASTWRSAFVAMVDDVLADATRFGVNLPVAGHAIRSVIGKHESLLESVEEPALVHFDAWEGNILLAQRDGRFEISGLIDGERAIWADPVADFVSPALFGDIADDPDFLAGYAGADASPFEITAAIGARLAMYKAYLDLVIIVEAAPRGYDAAERADVLRLATEDLHRCLDRLARHPRRD